MPIRRKCKPEFLFSRKDYDGVKFRFTTVWDYDLESDPCNEFININKYLVLAVPDRRVHLFSGAGVDVRKYLVNRFKKDEPEIYEYLMAH